MRILILIISILFSAISIGKEALSTNELESNKKNELQTMYTSLKFKADSGDVESMHNLFMLVSRNEPYLNEKATEAFSYMTQAGQKGYTEAQFTIGSMYQSGYMVKENIDVALTWLKEAAKSGHPEAQYLVGSNYFSRIQEADRSASNEYSKQAVFWYEKAIENGNVNALWQLGLLLVTTNEDLCRGKELIREAALKGDKRAMYFTAIEYKNLWLESGGESNFNEAVKWYENAIKLGHAASSEDLKELVEMREK